MIDTKDKEMSFEDRIRCGVKRVSTPTRLQKLGAKKARLVPRSFISSFLFQETSHARLNTSKPGIVMAAHNPLATEHLGRGEF
jgi:hypothetical protein